MLRLCIDNLRDSRQKSRPLPVAPPAHRSAFQIFVPIQSLLPERVWHCSFGAAPLHRGLSWTIHPQYELVALFC